MLDRLDLIEQTCGSSSTAGMPGCRSPRPRTTCARCCARTARGIIVTTIFRFEDAGLLNDRDNIVVMVDEAHRTQEGRSGDDMREALPNAQFFGLTGTPISDDGPQHLQAVRRPATTPAGSSTTTRSSARSPTAPRVPVHVETRLVDFHIDQRALDEAFAEMADEEGLDRRGAGAPRRPGGRGHARSAQPRPDRRPCAPTSSTTTSPRSRRSA